MKEIRRTPRPKGFTLKALSMQNDKRAERNLKKEIIREYIREDFYMMGMRLNLEEMALYLGMRPTTLLKKITKEEKRQSLIGTYMEEDRMNDAIRVLQSKAILGQLESHNLIHQQVHILRQQQGHRYVPFLTPALNQALGTLLQSNKGIQELLKAIQPDMGTTLNQQININQEATNKKKGQAMGTNEAIKLIAESNKGQRLLEAPEHLNALKAEIDNTPEVIATKQKGYIPDGAMILNKKSQPSGHEDRHEGTIEDAEVIDE